MRTEIIDLPGTAPGTRQSLRVLRFGAAGARPKVYVQAALHADEVPAILVAQQLARQLTELESRGAVVGEIVLVPFANPIGLDQVALGAHLGRFDLRDGVNFNRGFADLAALVVDRLRAQLSDDARRNTGLIRAALLDAADHLDAGGSAQALKNRLLKLAIDADIVLDLHCDGEAVLHVYALTPQQETAERLGAALGARALLLASDSGEAPFDEACSRPWLQLQRALPAFPIELACFGATVELRGQLDTDHTLASKDASGLCLFFAHQGVLAGPAAPLTGCFPVSVCAATPLASSEPIFAPAAGVVVFHRRPGEHVEAGDVIADLVDVESGVITSLRCQSAGLLYAVCGARWAYAGKRLAKIAGSTLARTGNLLSP